ALEARRQNDVEALEARRQHVGEEFARGWRHDVKALEVRRPFDVEALKARRRHDVKVLE
ncbi:hypothetical protein FS749_013452, partial [Ceratobasidium sp. UAMH 11750]